MFSDPANFYQYNPFMFVVGSKMSPLVMKLWLRSDELSMT